MKNLKLNTIKTIQFLAILFMASATVTSCSGDDDGSHHDEHEHEEANKLVYTLTNTTNANDVVTLTFEDLDGEGGQDGTYDVSGALTANANYTGVLQLLHEHEDGDVDNIGEEIAEEDAEDHELFYITNIAGLNFTTTDLDGNNNPLGFNTTVSTGASGNGTVTIAIIHEGKKPNNGTVADALSGAGTTDLEVAFSVEVQ